MTATLTAPTGADFRRRVLAYAHARGLGDVSLGVRCIDGPTVYGCDRPALLLLYATTPDARCPKVKDGHPALVTASVDGVRVRFEAAR